MPLSAADVDPDLYFTFAIKTVLNLGGSGIRRSSPRLLTFKPVRDGFEGFILLRSRDGSLVRDSAYRFEIRNEVGWDRAVERCADAYRVMLSFDPFEAEGPRLPIGINTSPAGRR